MDFMEIGAKLVQSKFGENLNIDTVKSALSSLLGDGNGDLDIAGLAKSFMANGGMASQVSSWLGDGGNAPVSASQIIEMLGSDKIKSFAATLGLGESEAAQGLSDVIPELVDKASTGGSLLESIGGAGGLASLAKGFF